MHQRTRPLRVALLGFGNVGRAVARMLSADQHSAAALDAASRLSLTLICTHAAGSRKVPWVADRVTWTDDFAVALGSRPDVLVELIGGLQPAERWIEQALVRGTSVVTANKQVIARSGARLQALASAHRCHLRFEAAVGGVVPVVRALGDGLAADRIRRITGILNGTCNYILSRVEADRTPFAVALAEAQARGFAEANPSGDVDGHDAAAKLAILATLAFHRHVTPAEVRTCSIANVTPSDFDRAHERGCTVRQLASAEYDGSCVRASVEPALVPLDSPFGRATGSENVILLTGDNAGDVLLSGPGAGPEPTAVAVVSDLLAIARDTVRPAAWTQAQAWTPRQGVAVP